MADDKINVLLIVGTGRSGSTILSLLLDQIADFFSVGEIANVFQRGFMENQLCGCNQAFYDCEMWSPIARNTYGYTQPEQAQFDDLKSAWEQIYNPKKMLSMYFVSRKNHPMPATIKVYNDHVVRLYRNILDQTGAKLIVDSSKRPTLGYALSMSPEVNLYVLHLVRDSRAVAFSWARKKRRPEIHWAEAYMPRYAYGVTIRMWIRENILSELFKFSSIPYKRIRYEDLIDHPQATLKSVCQFANQSDIPIDFLNHDNAFIPKENHLISGNPVRFQDGEIHLTPDDEWKEHMQTKDKRQITFWTSLFLLRYGYVL